MEALIYPYSLQVEPYLLRILSEQNEIDIKYLVYPKGWKLQNISENSYLNIEMSDDFSKCLDKVDLVIIPSISAYPWMRTEILKKVDGSLEKNKKVIWCSRLSIAERKKYTADKNFILLEEDLSDFCSTGIYKNPECIVVGIGNLMEDMDDSTGICYLENALTRRGYSVSSCSTNDNVLLTNNHRFPKFQELNNLSDKEKIIFMNNFIYEIETNDQPDILLVQIPGGMIKYSDIIPGDFGMTAYQMLQAVKCDFFILKTPCLERDFFIADNYRDLKTTVSYKYEVDIDAILIEGRSINALATDEEERVIFSNLSDTLVSDYINDYKKVNPNLNYYSLLIEKDYDQMADRLIDSLSVREG